MTKGSGSPTPKQAGDKQTTVLDTISIPKNNKLVVDSGFRVRDTVTGKSWNVKYFAFQCSKAQQKVIDNVLEEVKKHKEEKQQESKSKVKQTSKKTKTPITKEDIVSYKQLVDTFKAMDSIHKREFLEAIEVKNHIATEVSIL